MKVSKQRQTQNKNEKTTSLTTPATVGKLQKQNQQHQKKQQQQQQQQQQLNKSSGRTVKVDISKLEVPDVAWPTVILFFVSFVVNISTIYFGVKLNLSLFITIPIQAIATFVLFTPMHDAAHMSISKKYRFLNTIIGRLCGFSFGSPFMAFRWVHLQHHKYTNDPQRDPDYWAGSDPKILRPLRWMSQEYHYYVPYLQNRHLFSNFEVFEAVSSILVYLLIIAYFIYSGNFYSFLVRFFLPKSIATTFLAYAFDYAPHHPHQHKYDGNPYLTTSHIGGLFNSKGMNLAFPLLNQHIHNVHHLYSQVPFYRYGLIWDHYKQQLLDAGTPVTSLF